MIFWDLFWTFLKIGAFTFGGGYVIVPLMRKKICRTAPLD